MARYRLRSNARKRAFQALYASEFSTVSTVDELRTLFDRVPDEKDDEVVNPPANPEPTTGSTKHPDDATNPAEHTDGVMDSEGHTGEPDSDDLYTAFAWTLCAGTWANKKELDAEIGELSTKWRPERMGKVELTVLRLALYEMKTTKDVPPQVIISEALDLTRHFTEVGAKHIVNGILDAAAAKMGLYDNEHTAK